MDAITSEGDNVEVVDDPKRLGELLNQALDEGIETKTGSVDDSHYVLFRFKSDPSKVYAVNATAVLVWAGRPYMKEVPK